MSIETANFVYTNRDGSQQELNHSQECPHDLEEIQNMGLGCEYYRISGFHFADHNSDRYNRARDRKSQTVYVICKGNDCICEAVLSIPNAKYY